MVVSFLEHIGFIILLIIVFLFFKFKNRNGLEKLNIQRLKRTLDYLESKQRELKNQTDTDTRSLESMIKYLKKDMMEQFRLADHVLLSMNQEIKNTDTFIVIVKNIIDANS